ncbi:MAG: sugar transferase [Patescibacteria group bacterium]|nr:sugar transferase [Patescibacteria group bacterium]
MKKLELAFNIFSIFVDSAMLYLAGILSYLLRYRAENLFPQYPILFNLSLKSFSGYIAFAIPYLLIILAFYGLYNLKSTRKFWKTFLKIAVAVSTGLAIFIAAYFFNQDLFPSRLIILMAWILGIAFVAFGRYAILLTERLFLRSGIGLHKLVLIAEKGNDFNLISEIKRRPVLGYELISVLYPSERILEELEAIRSASGIDEILQVSSVFSRPVMDKILDFTRDYGIKFDYVPDIIESQQTNLSASSIAGVPVIELSTTPLSGWGRVVKRFADIVLSALALILTSPLFLLVYLGIKLDSSGKALFVQERFGQNRPFRFYKFRSMYQNLSVGEEYGGQEAEKMRSQLWKDNARHGPFLKIKNDPRVTRFGRFIRRTKLDELPQLYNVLMGDMSLVGPRAHVLDEVERYRGKYKRQFTIKPGITGLTQVTQAAIPELPFEEEMRLDTFYLENWSLVLDLSILLKTAWVLFKPHHRGEDY